MSKNKEDCFKIPSKLYHHALGLVYCGIHIWPDTTLVSYPIRVGSPPRSYAASSSPRRSRVACTSAKLVTLALNGECIIGEVVAPVPPVPITRCSIPC